MIILYLKQAWQLLKQNKLFSCIYILGTGGAIAMTMTLVMVYYIKITPQYPETNRDRTMVCKSAKTKNLESGGNSSSRFSYNMVQNFFYPLKNAETVTAFMDLQTFYTELPNGSIQPVSVKCTDTAFWRLFSFAFLSGKPFSEADFESGLRSAVIAQSLARQLFGEAEAVGQRFTLDAEMYQVCGVVKDASSLNPASYAQVWRPYTTFDGYQKGWSEILGGYTVYMLTKEGAGQQLLADEVTGGIRKMNQSQQEYEIDLLEQPVPYWKSIFYEGTGSKPDWSELLRTFGAILFALLFIPAMNLAGMLSSRMERRLSELGIRKSFGASRGALLRQMLVENLLLTVLGGAVGLMLSYGIFYAGRDWIPNIFSRFNMTPSGTEILVAPEMLFNLWIFGIMFGVCLLLNLLSAILPVSNALRKNIIYSLIEKR